MKVYAVQIPPEDQESPLFIEGCFPENIAVCGNPKFRERVPEGFQNVKDVLERGELAEMLEYPDKWYKSETEAIVDYLPPKEGRKYSDEEIRLLRSHLIDYSCCACSKENDILCEVLSIVDGRPWDWRSISGNCQDEWNEIFYPTDEWDEEDIYCFQQEYFNLGSKWLVDDTGEFDPEENDPSDISGFTMYTVAYDEDKIRAEIAEAAGCKPEDVVMYAFDGYIRHAKYKVV